MRRDFKGWGPNLASKFEVFGRRIRCYEACLGVYVLFTHNIYREVKVMAKSNCECHHVAILRRKTRAMANFVFDPSATVLYLARSFTELKRLKALLGELFFFAVAA